jgi:hypothetical protein
MFHHPNGTCCVLDCQSNHGTYVNGNRIPPITPVPLRRGSLIRFGGVGAPSFILKCFTTALKRLVCDLDGIADTFSSTSSREFLLVQQQAQKSGVACIRGGEGGIACIGDEKDAPTAALVLLNTRLNAYPRGISSLNQMERALIMRSKERFNEKIQKFQASPIKRKMSVVNFSNVDDGRASKKRNTASSSSGCSMKSILINSNIKNTKRKPVDDVTSPNTPLRTRVLLGDCNNYPAAITPDELSLESDEEEDDAPLTVRNPFLEVSVPAYVEQF